MKRLILSILLVISCKSTIGQTNCAFILGADYGIVSQNNFKISNNIVSLRAGLRLQDQFDISLKYGAYWSNIVAAGYNPKDQLKFDFISLEAFVRFSKERSLSAKFGVGYGQTIITRNESFRMSDLKLTPYKGENLLNEIYYQKTNAIINIELLAEYKFKNLLFEVGPVLPILYIHAYEIITPNQTDNQDWFVSQFGFKFGFSYTFGGNQKQNE